MEVNFSKEDFIFAEGDFVDTVGEGLTHSGGFVSDAWRRFKKNRASIAALCIIIFIVLFAVFTPVFLKKNDMSPDSYYSKKGAKVEALSSIPFLDGGRKKTFNERGLIHEYAIALGCTQGTNIKDIPKEYRTVITDFDKIISSKENGYYNAEVDTYSEVGFVYMQLGEQEYLKILEYQNKTGIQIFYPLVAGNEYNPNPQDANYWYRADTNRKNSAIDKNGNRVKLSESLNLCDNYLRDAEGNPVYFRKSGGESPVYYVRVLYKNYYTYKNGGNISYIFGTDAQGYDLALRLAKGIRLSLILSLSVFVINFIIGAFYGALEGYYGGVLDLTLERLADIISCIPFIVVATLFQLHFAERAGVVLSLLFAFVLTGWIPIASRVRSQFYRFKNREYVMSAKTLGAGDGRIILRHIFPNALGTLVTSSVLMIPTVILNESMLSFLGIVNLGSKNMTSLGTLLSESASIWTNFPHLMILPAIVISLLMICFNLFGNGLRDALDPSSSSEV